MSRWIATLALALFLAAPPLEAQESEEEEEVDHIDNQTELALVQTSGNSDSFTFSFRNKFVRIWERSRITIDAKALRSESTTRTLTNEGGRIVESNDEEVTAERYGLSFQYDRDISERTGWFSRGGWERNRPSGIDNRWNVVGGLSYLFFDDQRHRLVGDAGLGYTLEEPVQGDEQDFPTGRLFSRYERSLSDTASFETELELIENLDDFDDLRANFLIGVTAEITERLALKASYAVTFDNQPITEIVEGNDPGEEDLVFVFDTTDTILAVSLVVDF